MIRALHAALRQRFTANPGRLVPQRKPLGGETRRRFAYRSNPDLSAAAMWTGIHIEGRRARGSKALSVQTVVIAGLLGMLPLAASSAASPEDSAVQIDPATSAAVIELVPVLPSPEVTAPSAPQETVIGQGSASYYAAKFHGRRTASGESFDNNAMTAAHRTLPFGTMVRVTNPSTGASVVVRINDRGPFTRGRMIDVSRAAAEELGLIARGHATVELALITS